MDVDEHQDESSEQHDEMSSEESTHRLGSAERNQQSSPFSESKVFRLSPIEFDSDSGADGEDFPSSSRNGLDHIKGINEEEEEEEQREKFEAATDISFLKDKSLTASPTRNFKSSYAKSLADSYRRASLPVVVGSPKGQFYFKNDEFLSLNARPARLSGFGQDKYVSLNSSSTRSPSLPGFEPLSLPTILDVVPEPQELPQEVRESKTTTRNLYSQLLNEEEVFVPYERLQKFCEEGGGNFSLQDWHSLGSLITSDGRKLVKLSDFQERVKKHKTCKLIENGYPVANGGEKDAQVEGLRMERGQLEGRIEQLCDVLAERDNTVQRLEEDLLRIRMECQRLIVENRALRSNLGQPGSSVNGESLSQVGKLEQQVQLLTAQLSRAERSRHTYEAATRQLVDFLHTVNSTLSTSTSPSPSTSLVSVPASSPVTHSIQTEDEGESDPPYRLAQPQSTMPETRARSVSHTFGPIRRNSDMIRRAGSVCALPTQSGTSNRVSRAASTYCVATEVQRSSHGEATASGSQDKGGSPGKSHTSEFLATRAKELITSLKSLMRSENRYATGVPTNGKEDGCCRGILKLNLEPKKSGSGMASGSNTSRSTKSDGHSSLTTSEDHNRTTIWHIPPEVYFGDKPRDDNQNIAGGSCSTDDDSSTAGQSIVDGKGMDAALNNNNNKAPSSARDGRLQVQPVEVNGSSQPLSLTVVGDPSSSSSSSLDDRRFSSLPNRGHTARNLNDSEHRLVWV
ncbi:serine-rich adhesin for platelets-like isoform X1 [Penaeus indicus]|uniref:serine-rich adhesin for platelets-like isoform X1 n=1 Tax=Penaeus indicus TaxID=29960 RepID=UPI00300C3774